MPLTVKLDCAVLGILGGDTGLGIELVAEHDHLVGQTLRGRSGIQVQLARVDGDGDSLLGFEGLLVHGGVGDAVLAVFVGVNASPWTIVLFLTPELVEIPLTVTVIFWVAVAPFLSAAV